MSGLMEEGMARAMAFQSNQAFQRISAMKEALRLSPEQEAALRETAVVSLEESARLARAEWAREISPEQRAAAMREDAAAREQQLQGMLSPDQRIAYEQFQRDEQAQSARRSAAHSAEQIQQSLNLSAQQAEQVQSALYELNLKDTAIAGRNRADTLDTPDLIVRDQTARLEAQLQALSGVLTPEQLAQYREEQVKEISRAAALIRFVQTFSAPTNR